MFLEFLTVISFSLTVGIPWPIHFHYFFQIFTIHFSGYVGLVIPFALALTSAIFQRFLLEVSPSLGSASAVAPLLQFQISVLSIPIFTQMTRVLACNYHGGDLPPTFFYVGKIDSYYCKTDHS
jgi:hypothetical protein